MSNKNISKSTNKKEIKIYKSFYLVVKMDELIKVKAYVVVYSNLHMRPIPYQTVLRCIVFSKSKFNL